MGLSNFIVVVAGVGAVILLMRTDVKKSATVFSQNVQQARNWVVTESTAVFKKFEKASKDLTGLGCSKAASE